MVDLPKKSKSNAVTPLSFLKTLRKHEFINFGLNGVEGWSIDQRYSSYFSFPRDVLYVSTF
jgi:hypothetical protein